MIRIWFNHWFSTAYNLINSAKEADKDKEFYFVATNQQPLAVYQLVCDEFYVEPNLDSTEYVEWCLQFCKDHNINVFCPRKNRLAISKNYQRFTDIGVKVLVEDNYELLAKLNSKSETAKIFQANNICEVPEMIIVNTVDEFKQTYEYLKRKYPEDKVCFKFDIDEGGLSFRVIDDVVSDISLLRKSRGLKINYTDALSIFGGVDRFEDLIMMRYLDGPEISIDSLMTSKGFIGCSREKIGTRSNLIKTKSEFIEISKRFAEVTGIKHPYNLQMRWHKGKLYLLEVNTRMAGGTHKANLAGMNFSYISICDLLGKDFELPKPTDNIIVTEIETPLILGINYE